MRCRGLRLAAATIAAGCAVVVWQVAELIAAAARPSGLMIGAVVVGVVGGIAAAGLMLAPPLLLQRVLDRSQSLVCAVRAVEPLDDRRTGLLLIALGMLTYVLLVGRILSLPGPLGTSDEAAYLQTATTVHESGGPLRLIADLYGGRFAEANRHPLYIALLSLRPTERFGRGLSAVLGLVTLITLTLLAARSRGTVAAGVLCVLLATNLAFCRFSLRIVCDVLMVLWGGVAFLLLARKEALLSHEVAVMPVRRALLVGVVLGMAYLTKGTGILMLVGTLAAWGALWMLRTRGGRVRSEANGPAPRGGNFLRRKIANCKLEIANLKFAIRNLQFAMSPSRGRDRSEADRGERAGAIGAREPALRRGILTLLVILSGWILVASPLLVRNVKRYGMPLYNTNTWLLFVDAFESPLALSQRQSVAETARVYWESHTLAEMAQREISGLAWETFILLRMLGPYPLDDSRAVVGLPLLVLALLQLVARPCAAGVVLASWTSLFILLFAWYVPIAAGERFLFPLLAPLLLVAGEGLIRVLGMGTGRDPSRHRQRIGWAAAVWCAASLLLSYTTHWPVEAR